MQIQAQPAKRCAHERRPTQLTPAREIFGQVVRVLSHVCPHVQLSSRSLHVNFERKLKYELALAIAKFTSTHGAAADVTQTAAAVRGPRATARQSQFAGHESHTAVSSSLAFQRPSPPKSIASETKLKGHATH